MALFVAVDVHYLGDETARAALVAASDRRFSCVVLTRTALVADVEPYRPGEFYRRELPPLRAVLTQAENPALIVVDGYVDLDPGGRPGLGAHVHDEFGIPVIGVAKTAFGTATHAARVFRGQSSRPLYVTAAGMTISDAAGLVAEMTGRFRVPDALKRVDRLARGLELPDAEHSALARRGASGRARTDGGGARQGSGAGRRRIGSGSSRGRARIHSRPGSAGARIADARSGNEGRAPSTRP